MKRQKKPHPADIAEDALIAQATAYNVHFLKGPFDRLNEPAATLDAAYDAADALNKAHGGNGRRAIIYAILPGPRAIAISQQTRPEEQP